MKLDDRCHFQSH